MMRWLIPRPPRASGMLFVKTTLIVGFLIIALIATVWPHSSIFIIQRPFDFAQVAFEHAETSVWLPSSTQTLLAYIPTETPKDMDEQEENQSKEHSQETPREFKYFYEAGVEFDLIHYDRRYFVNMIPYEEHMVVLRNLVRSYLAMTRKAGIETWLAHGTLLGWWWNERIMPWDDDIDVQVSDTALRYMGDRWNMTLHQFDLDTLHINRVATKSRNVDNKDGNKDGSKDDNNEDNKENDNDDINNHTHALTARTRTYLLDVNPNSIHRHRGDGVNLIDARWIDVENGMFVDITGLTELDPESQPGVLSCKNDHHYSTDWLFPLRHGQFEGVPAITPAKVELILADEYGNRSMVDTEWCG